MRLLPRELRGPGDGRAEALVLVVMAAFVVGVYVVIVLGGGALIGHTESPQLGLSILATAVVAWAFEPLRARVESWALRGVHRGRRSAYEVISRFSDDVCVPTADDRLPDRMARVLAEGTGARWTQVWVIVNKQPTLAGGWPVGDPEVSAAGLDIGDTSGTHLQRVAVGGEVLGALRLREQEGQPLSPMEERLFAGLAAQAGVQLRAAQLRTELAQRLDELSERARELTRSRERLVDMQDDRRRRLERDIHDGAQQHLVALAVNLRLAQTLAVKSPERAAAVLAEQITATDNAMQSLLDLSRGIYPTALSEDGIAVALRGAATSSPIAVRVVDHGIGRYSDEVQAAVYFCCLEALQNAVKHSGATEIVIDLRHDGDELTWGVTDDGHGFDLAAATSGEGLANMHDRMDAAGGRLVVEPGDPSGARIRGSVPTHEIVGLR